MSALSNLHSLRDQAVEMGLTVRLCKDGVLVVATPHGEEADNPANQQGHGGAGPQGRQGGHGQGEGA